MHFTTLFILKGEKLEDLSQNEIEELFSERFCYNCGETKPKYLMWCDWFQTGGRWPDIIKAKKGIHCERGWSNDNAPIIEGEYSIVNIEDLTEPLPRDLIYSVATKSKLVMKSDAWRCGEVNEEKFDKILEDIKNNRNEMFNTKIDKDDLFNLDNLSENSLNFLLYIDGMKIVYPNPYTIYKAS